MLPLPDRPERPTAVAERPSSEMDSALDLLADSRRRSVLRYLGERATATPVSLSELAAHVVLEGRDRHVGTTAIGGQNAVPPTERRRVAITLRHVHVPKLADADVVDFDIDANVVSLTDEGRTLVERWNAIRGPVV